MSTSLYFTQNFGTKSLFLLPMNFSLRIARRYLFSENFWGVLFIVFLVPYCLYLLINWVVRLPEPAIIRRFKEVNAIHIITGIAVLGIGIGTAALILVLSVFNGFEDLITDMYSNFNPDVKVTPIEGKTFEVDTVLLEELQSIGGVEYVAQSLEEIAFFENVVRKKRRDSIFFDRMQDFGIIKGVDENFRYVTNLDSTIRGGEFLLEKGSTNYAILGLGMWNKLGIRSLRDRAGLESYQPINVYMPKRRVSSPFEQQFKRRIVYPAGAFMIQQDFDNQYILTSLSFARELLSVRNEVSALEIKLDPAYGKAATIDSISAVVGPEFEVKDRYQQEEAFLKLMQVEKWLSYAIVSLMMLMVAFNMIGALWMIVLEKKPDIAILKSMGAQDRTIRNIFLNEGLLLSALGIIIGIVTAFLIYGVQKSVGIVSIPGDFIVEAYPISLRIPDFVIVALTVLVIGLLASMPAARKAMSVSALIREE